MMLLYKNVVFLPGKRKILDVTSVFVIKFFYSLERIDEILKEKRTFKI